MNILQGLKTIQLGLRNLAIAVFLILTFFYIVRSYAWHAPFEYEVRDFHVEQEIERERNKEAYDRVVENDREGKESSDRDYDRAREYVRTEIS